MSTVFFLVQCEDHPRVCGEQEKMKKWWESKTGSPPRVRGTAKQGAVSACTIWITPACAGNSLRKAVTKFLLRDHPRVCGEQEATAISFSDV